MIEAVGHAFYDTYFKCCSELLKPNSMMLLQAIIITDHLYERAKRSVDFIQRYIFPGSCIPSIAAMHQSLARTTDIRLFHLEDITPYYVKTLRQWRERFFANISRVRALGYPEEFIRMWEFYLCYCEGGFAERVIGEVQMLLTKPLCQRASILPPLAIV
jgi:cyclopropane-fatty-acyl-phospholipid synthase